MDIKKEAQKEKARRVLEQRYKPQRENLKQFLFEYWKQEKKVALDDNWHIDLICDKLEAVQRWEITRLIIEVPPRSLKTETVARAFPAWCMWKKPTKFISISYSWDLAKASSEWTREIFNSSTYKKFFPRKADISKTQAEKTNWRTEDDSQYYSAGSEGTITGVWCDIMIIDDPLKPKDAKSDTVRNSVNRNYTDTLKSRLNDKEEGAIIIIMQRLHEDDLVWMLKEKILDETWENFEIVTIKAIAEEDELYRKKWESFFSKRFPLHILNVLLKEDPDVFRTQYQQTPAWTWGNEFFREWFRYYDHFPKDWRVFTAVDPAFKDNEWNDYVAITTAKITWWDCYILEQSVERMQTPESIDKIIEHIRKWDPEMCWIEDKWGQIAYINSVRSAVFRERLNKCEVFDIKQRWSKEEKIRSLTNYYRNWYIYHPHSMNSIKMSHEDKQKSHEEMLLAFPLWKHDDAPDSLQMLLSMIDLQPSVSMSKYKVPTITYNKFWMPQVK